MDNEKDVFKAIATLGRAIADFELTIYCKNEEIKRLKETNIGGPRLSSSAG